jgi:hypothetical protein
LKTQWKKNHSIIQEFPITLVCARQQIALMPTLNPKTIEAMTRKCEYYRFNQKVRYAKVFVRTTEALAVSASGIFRYGLIGS